MRVPGDSGKSVVVAVGRTVSVTDGSVGFVGAMVTVAGTFGNSVVGEIGCTFKVVTTRGIDVGIEADAVIPAEAPTVRVAGSEVPKTVDCDGITTSVVEGSLETVGANVRVAGTLGSKVVGEMGCTVKVVTTNGIEVGSVAEMPAEALRVSVAGAEVSSTVD